MGDLIDRQAARDALYDADAITMQGVAMLNTFPAADAVEVVRCKDCRRWRKDFVGCTEFVGRCEWAGYMVGANGYCVYGERK